LSLGSWLLAAALSGLAGAAPAADWRSLDPDNSLVIETSRGRIIVEMRPDLAPLAVARIKLLAREHVYDGLLFHRVIDGFVDQTGNPNNHDGGGSAHPDLPPEFSFRTSPANVALARQASDGVEGFVGSTPVVGEAPAARRSDGTLRAWGAYCAGVAGMGRQADPGSANSEIFFMRAPARRLDHDYTVWGRVVVGLDVVRAVAAGEPPAHPDRMLKVSVMADLPAAERPGLEIMDTRSTDFRVMIEAVRTAKGADFSVCDVEVPVRAAR
jgi:peptidylprolyl isomerase